LIEQGGFQTQTLEALKQHVWRNAKLIRVTPEDILEGAADPRRDGAAQEF